MSKCGWKPCDGCDLARLSPRRKALNEVAITLMERALEPEDDL